MRLGIIPGILAILFFLSLFSACQTPKSETTQWEGFLMERTSVKAHDGTAIPLILLTPRNGNSPSPCVLLIHGITSSKDLEWLQRGSFSKGGDLTLGLLQEGFAVAALDVRMHGERKKREYADF